MSAQTPEVGGKEPTGYSRSEIADFARIILDSGDILAAIQAVDPAEAEAYKRTMAAQAMDMGRKDAMGYAPNLAAGHLAGMSLSVQRSA